MLAQAFLPHTTLGLSQAERTALIKVLGVLERDELPHYERPGFSLVHADEEFNPVGFNMARFHANAACGTVHCIAGLAEVLGGLGLFTLTDRKMLGKPLGDLFGIGKSAAALTDITPAQAAQALRNFLTTGAAGWKEILA